jgi:hypothetical protein
MVSTSCALSSVRLRATHMISWCMLGCQAVWLLFVYLYTLFGRKEPDKNLKFCGNFADNIPTRLEITWGGPGKGGE